jgi:hypothetical protein
MMTRKVLPTLVICFVAMAWALPASAAERQYWRHGEGHFENTRGNHWTERHSGDIYRFVEMDRTPKYVELYDKSRDCTVRLFDGRCMVKFGDQRFERYYDGGWSR